MKNTDGLGNIMRQLREEKGLSRNQLTKGICDESLLRKYEEGLRSLNLFVRMRLFERLSESNMHFEFFANHTDYTEWLLRKQIINAYNNRDFDKLESHLCYYKVHKNISNCLSEQFYWEMKALMMIQQGLSNQESITNCKTCLKKAIEKTICIKDGYVINFVLSAEEINMLIEYSLLLEPFQAYKNLNDLYQSIKKKYSETETSIIILPKIVYHMIRLNKNYSLNLLLENDIYIFVTEIIEFMIASKRINFLPELINILPEKNSANYINYDEWQELFKQLEILSEVSFKASDCNFLFYNHSVLQIGDILKQRRQLYSLTTNEVSKNICDSKTLSNIENHKTDGQPEVIVALLNRLKIAEVLQKGSFHYSDIRQLRREMVFKNLVGNSKRDYLGASTILENIKNDIDLNNLYNLQYILSREASLQYKKGTITAEDYYQKLLDALSLTIDIATINTYDVYLSRTEINCCYNISLLPQIKTIEYQKSCQLMLYLADNYTDNEDLKVIEMAFISSAHYHLKNNDIKRAVFYYKRLLQKELMNARFHLTFFAISRIHYCNTLLPKEDQLTPEIVDSITTSSLFQHTLGS